MFNVAIINKKEIIKSIINILIVVFIIFICSKILNNKDEEIIKSKQINLNICFEQTVPQIKQKEEAEQKEKKSFIAKIFETELSSFYIKNAEMDENTTVAENENTQNTNENEQSSVSISDIQTNTPTEEATRSPISTNYTNNYNGVFIKNETSYGLTEDILNPNIDINKQNVVIFHTHTCESYTASEKYPYTPTGNYRTTDLNYSVARVGDELSTYLTQYGFNVIHDKTYHDYPAYTGSYTRSQATVENILKSQQSDIIIDLHRDAIGSNSEYAPAVKIGDETAAKIMFVIGSNGGGLWHPNWQQNLKFAVKIQQKANELYPGFAKPIIFRNSRYNQQLGKAACIIEVGSTGNTLDECLNSMKYLATVMNEALK